MSHSNEHAFALIELLIALIVVSILMAIAIGSFGGAKSTGSSAAATAVAQSYDQAIASFGADHTNRVPVPGTSPDWPNVVQGPLEPNIAGGSAISYLKSVPEHVSTGQVAVVTTPVSVGSDAPAPSLVSIRVDTSTAPAVRYRVEIWTVVRHKVTNMRCWLGSWAPAGGEAKC